MDVLLHSDVLAYPRELSARPRYPEVGGRVMIAPGQRVRPDDGHVVFVRDLHVTRRQRLASDVRIIRLPDCRLPEPRRYPQACRLIMNELATSTPE